MDGAAVTPISSFASSISQLHVCGVSCINGRLPQDLQIEILSYLNLSESNSLAHVNHEWLEASRVERRRLVEVTSEMVRQLEKQEELFYDLLTTVISSPLSRLITRLPNEDPFKFNHQQTITTAHTNFPNLLSMDIILRQLSEYSPLSRVEPLTQTFHLPPRLLDINIEYAMPTITIEQQQLYLDSLAAAPQLQTICLKKLDPDLNLTVLTQLPQLTDLIIYPESPTTIPAEVLRVLNSLKQLVSLRLSWTMRPDQWSQLQLPQLQHISLGSGGVSCSTDLIPLMQTVMIKSMRYLCLRFDSREDAEVSKLMGLVKFTQLEKLDLEIWSFFQHRVVIENDLRDIQAALAQLTTLTSLKIGGLRVFEKDRLAITDVLAASVHLTALEFDASDIIDFSFLCTPLAQQQLIDLNLRGVFTMAEMVDGLLHCRYLRRLQIESETPSSHDWWEAVKRELDSRDALPNLEQLTMTNIGIGRLREHHYDHTIDHVEWSLHNPVTKNHPKSFRLKRTLMVIEVIGVDGLTSITQLLEWNDLISLSQVNYTFRKLLTTRHSAYCQLPLPSFHRNEFNVRTYQQWLEKRRPLVMSPEELLIYSVSTVMTHATDIELQIDLCQFHTDPFTSSSVVRSGTTPNTKWVVGQNQPSPPDLRWAVRRFQRVRCFRIVFRHPVRSVAAAPSCPCRLSQTSTDENDNADENDDSNVSNDDGDSAASDQITHPVHQLIKCCLQQWGPNLISFEFNIDETYLCTIPHDHLHSLLPVFTSLQFCSIRIPDNRHDVEMIEHTFSSLRFASDDVGLVMFSGWTSFDASDVDNNELIQTQPTPVRYSNAVHVLGGDRSIQMMCKPTLEYFYQTQQLVLSSTISTTIPAAELPHHIPCMPVRREQLRNFTFDPNHLPFQPETIQLTPDLVKATHRALQMMVDNFTNAISSPATSSIESGVGRPGRETFLQTVIFTEFSTPATRRGLKGPDGTEYKVDYRPYLHHLRTNLRAFHFDATQSPTKTLISQSEPTHFRPDLPFFLCITSSSSNSQNTTVVDQEDYIWPKLESLNLSFPKWSGIYPDFYIPAIDHETWIDLGRTFPRVQNLGLSGGLLSLTQPLVGLMTQITRMTLNLFLHTTPLGLLNLDAAQEAKLESARRERTVSAYLRTIVLGARQLKFLQLHLSLSDVRPCLAETLLPLLLSSDQLTEVRCDYHRSHMDEPTDSESHESDLFFVYALWKYLQPSFKIPLLDYSTTFELYSPFLTTRRRQTLSTAMAHPAIDGVDFASDSLRSWFIRWRHLVDGRRPSQHRPMIVRPDVSDERQKWLQTMKARRIKLQTIQTDLSARVKDILATSPLTTPQPYQIPPRAFTFKLDPIR